MSNDCTKEMMSAFKTIDILQGSNLEFEAWKESIASHLATHPVWKNFVITSNPPEFIKAPVPQQLEDADRALFAAMKSRMDSNAKKLVPSGTCGGIQLMEDLTAACQPTLSDMNILTITGQLTNPRRYASETPQEYLFRLQQQQQMLAQQNIQVNISPLVYVKGLVVQKQVLTSDKVAFKDDVEHISKYGMWPQTWDCHKHNILNLAMQINREFKSMRFKENKDGNKTPRNRQGGTGNNDSNTPYVRADKVTSKTSDAHKKDFDEQLQANPSTFFTTGWGATLLKNTPSNICIYHGTPHPTGKCHHCHSHLPNNLKQTLPPLPWKNGTSPTSTAPAPSPTPAPYPSNPTPSPKANQALVGNTNSSSDAVTPYLQQPSVDNIHSNNVNKSTVCNNRKKTLEKFFLTSRLSIKIMKILDLIPLNNMSIKHHLYQHLT